MAKKLSATERMTLSYPKHALEPREVLDFIELDGFIQSWERLGLDDTDRKMLRVMLQAGPARFPIVRGTGGLRKIRFSPPRSHQGKSGGMRVCYAYFCVSGIVLLVEAYSKRRKDDLTAAEKKAIKAELEQFKRRLSRGPLR